MADLDLCTPMLSFSLQLVYQSLNKVHRQYVTSSVHVCNVTKTVLRLNYFLESVFSKSRLKQLIGIPCLLTGGLCWVRNNAVVLYSPLKHCYIGIWQIHSSMFFRAIHVISLKLVVAFHRQHNTSNPTWCRPQTLAELFQDFLFFKITGSKLMPSSSNPGKVHIRPPRFYPLDSLHSILGESIIQTLLILHVHHFHSVFQHFPA